MQALIAGEILNGFATGMLYALAGAGLSLILGVLNIPNFAHGTLYALGAYLTFSLVKVSGSFYLAVALAPLAVIAVGLVLESQATRRLYSASHDYQLLLLFALSLILQEIILIIWGPVGFSVLPPEALSSTIDFGFVAYPVYRLFLIAVSLAVIIGLWLFLSQTNVGAILRAGMENREMVAILGFDINRIFLWAFGLGAYLAGLAGALAAPVVGLTPSMGGDMLPICFAIVVIGGLGSILGAIFSGILIGMCQSLTSVWWPQGSNLAIYLFMGLVIMARPQGFFGTR
jgi:branched-chain amino acid transport system permease protein